MIVPEINKEYHVQIKNTYYCIYLTCITSINWTDFFFLKTGVCDLFEDAGIWENTV
jgi:hypothetical protein